MTTSEVLSELQKMGTASIKKVLTTHGAREPFYGVKVADLKKIQKRIKKDQKLALELFDSGVSDAMYLAGMIVDPKLMKKTELNHWADKAYWYMLSEYTVAGVAAESPFAVELALEWIESDRENIATAGWNTLGLYAAITPDEMLDITLFKKMADRAAKELHKAPNRVRYCMNTFLISVGAYITPLTPHVIKLAEKIGKVEVNMGDTACKVPAVIPYLKKIESMGRLGKKRKTALC